MTNLQGAIDLIGIYNKNKNKMSAKDKQFIMDVLNWYMQFWCIKYNTNDMWNVMIHPSLYPDPDKSMALRVLCSLMNIYDNSCRHKFFYRVKSFFVSMHSELMWKYYRFRSFLDRRFGISTGCVIEKLK